MNGITGAGQDPAASGTQGLPPSSFDRLDRLDDSFSPAIPGQTRAEWLENARTSTSPAMQAYYRELVTLAGGRTDDAALNQVIDRYQALQNAATASEVQAAERGWLDQIGSMLSRYDPIDRLLDTAQPHIAGLAREAGLGETAWGASLQRVLDAPGSISAFREGMRAGVLAGAQDLVVGTLELAGQALQYGADNSLAGRAGDALRGLTGALPGALDAVVPSAQRGAATSEKLADMGGKIGDYLGAVANDPGRLKTDIINAIDAQWSRLEASHAAAAAQGPQAEARWWGETVGRVTFEVAATFVPVAGQAGKVSTAAKVADGVGDVARVADSVSDAARIANAADNAAGATRTANRAEDVGDAARATQAADAATDVSRAARAGQVIEHTFGNNTVRYSYDAQGRLVSARAELSEVYSGLDRSSAEVAAQRDVARLGKTGDQGGHAVGHRFLGDQGERAMFPQNGVPRDVIINGETVRLKNLNSGAFARLENEIADWIGAGGKVDYQIEFFDFDGARPARIQVSYEVTDSAGRVVFDNVKEFSNQAGQSYNRVAAADMAAYFE